MRSFTYLYLATVREFVRDRSALFWTIAFPVMFILIFGVIFSSGEEISFNLGLVNEDGRASALLVENFKRIGAFDIHEGSRADELEALEDGERSAVIVIPTGTGEALGKHIDQSAQTGSDAPAPALLDLYYDSANQNNAQIVVNIINHVVAEMNVGITGQVPALSLETQSVSTNNLRYIDYFLPGVLAMSLMQLGLFGTAAPLVSLREKQVLRRMGATPLSKSTLLASQIVFRLTSALVQTGIIVVVGVLVFDVQIIAANALSIIGIVLLGGTMFITLGYFISGFARTEEAVQGIISLPNFIFMFLSGIFFPLEMMPSWIRPLVDVIPLTYLSDALRATMTEAGDYFSMTRSVLIMTAWLAVCAVLAVRFFKWEPQA